LSDIDDQKETLNTVESIAALYSDSFMKHGVSLAALNIPKGAQDARFKAMFEIGSLDNTRILDVGCGFGHMLDFLRSWNINAQYTGIDICPPMIDTARHLHPEGDFRLLNILEAPIDERWDWVFLVGAFNVAPAREGWWEYVQQMMRRMFELCTRGMAADFLSSYVDFQKPGAFHASPEQVFNFAKTITRRVTLRHDYMAYEFMVYLYMDQRLTEKNVFVGFKSTPRVQP
jgi:SAM-dependent methyltransferase